MFELVGTHFEKGIFELRFEESQRGLKALYLKLGPVQARFVALIFFLTAAFLTYYRQPGFFLLRKGWVTNLGAAFRAQQVFNWTLMGFGLLLYVGILLVHRKSLLLIFDRSKATIRYREESSSRFKTAEEGLISFSELK